MLTLSDRIELSSLDTYDNLLDFLVSIGYSKNQIKKYLSKGELKKKIARKMLLQIPINLINSFSVNPGYDGPAIEIVYEDEHFVVMNKPKLIHSHPLSYLEKNNCLSFLLSKGYHLKQTNAYDSTLLHRLDFETSGCLVLAKKYDEYLKMRENFNQITKEKIYLAIVEGEFTHKGHFICKLATKGENNSKVFVSDSGQEVKASFECLEYSREKNLSLVKVYLETGHRHQLRVQLAFMGNPILGDTFYGGKASSRLFLHSLSYQVVWENQTYRFVSKNAELFDSFFDLNRCLKMFNDI
ncbi:MAG: RluA family pseudouridine synthase [Bacteriovoracaceae bacterium]|nr:RluA family pseudouridine synthase [Bacteriovoracaceae bacterium]